MPCRKRLRLGSDGSACDCDQAKLTVQVSIIHVAVDWIDEAWVDTRQQHGFVGQLPCPGANGREAYFDSPSQ